MKTTFLSLAFCLAIAFGVNAQVSTPAPSPYCKVEQTVGLTDIHLEYSRPSVKDRKVFGDLVPYDKVWRTGANSATKITFTTDVKVNGTEVPAGDYALITKPGMEEWELHFLPYVSAGVGQYMSSEDDRIIAKTSGVNELPFVMESFMMMFDNLRNSSANMHNVWERTNAYGTIEVPTEEAVMASIESTMAGPGAGDYSAAASYYLAEGKDLNQALEWINKSLEMGGERFWILRTKSEIQAKLGDYKGAIATAERSKELAEESRNADYIKINTDNITEWSKM